jgi:exopolyphosphatase / guanosine-5'-triphosphate,3'-diphosphate pyrophosphatase
MEDHFAVIDVGSNATKFQIALVDQPKRYHVIEQDRRPVRLGHNVFHAGRLDGPTATAALKVFSEFKSLADRYRVKAMRGVGTSALRAACDGKSFLCEADKLGVPLEVLSEEDEARLISVGIMSGLQFHLPLGLFVDIGGGSIELAVANTTNVFCLFSLPLGAVRLTEALLSSDPPRRKEIQQLRNFIKSKLRLAARRIEREKFTMAFGSGGTITALAETATRIAGNGKPGSLTILRRSSLEALLELLTTLPTKQRASLISGDPKRADIIIAGAIALLETMFEIGLDYLFVSRRGLRDGLMVDLLQKYYQEPGGWLSDAERTESLEQVCQKYLFDAPHAHHVSQLALNIFYQLTELHHLSEKYAAILSAAATLHDIGAFIAQPKHHKHSYYLIKSSGMSSFSKVDLDIIANVARYHRKAHPSPKHLGFSQLSPSDQEIVRKLSAILRIADAFDYRHEQKIKSVTCSLKKSKTLTIIGSATDNGKDETEWILKKGELLHEVFNVNLNIQTTSTNRSA